MATCARCGASGFTLKVDSYSHCESCQQAVRMDLEKRAYEAEKRSKELHSALTRANGIIDEKDKQIEDFTRRFEELKAEIGELEAKKATVQEEIEAEKAEAQAEIEAAKAATEADCEAVLKDTNAQISKLLRSATNRFDKYAETLPKPRARATKKTSTTKEKESKVKRSKFPLVSPQSFFACSDDLGYIVLDLETTGLSSVDNRIIEIGAIKIRRNRPSETFSTYINPGRPINPAATAVNGITDSMVAGSPPESEAIRKFIDFMGDIKHIAAHNAPFYTDFLAEACLRCGEYLHCHVFDILRYCRDEFPDLGSYKLGALARKFGFRSSSTRRALGNAEIVAQFTARFEKKYRN
jgi:DNA polymerase III epsilon subunit family exonuclease